MVRYRSNFKRGFIFGRPYTSDEIRTIRRYVKTDRVPEGWFVYDTPLAKYMNGSNFERLLQMKVFRAREATEKLRILDVGVGSGRQWLDFLGKNPEVDFHATSLSKMPVVDELKDRTVVSLARNIHNKFEAGTFDVIVCHFGAHHHEKGLIECAHHLLKSGGVLYLTYLGRDWLTYSNRMNLFEYFSLHKIGNTLTLTKR